MKKIIFDGIRLEGKKVDKILKDLVNETNFSDKDFSVLPAEFPKEYYYRKYKR